jgi:nascent polypeptide-associated complex subunit alpha
MHGQDSYQISGETREETMGEVKLDISLEDVKMVAAQAKVSEKKAREALENSGGDLAQAILDLKT